MGLVGKGEASHVFFFSSSSLHTEQSTPSVELDEAESPFLKDGRRSSGWAGVVRRRGNSKRRWNCPGEGRKEGIEEVGDEKVRWKTQGIGREHGMA